MESREFLKFFLSVILQCKTDNIKLWHGLDQADTVISTIQSKSFQYNIIIGFDQPEKECWPKIDQWLSTQSEEYAVFLLDENFLNIKQNQNKLQKIIPIPFNHDLISNLALLREIKSCYHFNFDNQTTRWLFLSRNQRPHRRYFIDTWAEKIQHNLVYSDGKDRPIGNIDFYNLNRAPYMCNAKNLLDLTDIYNQTSGSIVAETSLDSFLTEKTFHAILAMHPIMMIGPRFAIGHLRSQGFDVFDDLINHSYDQLESWQERINCLVNDNFDVLTRGIDRRTIKDRLVYNQNHIWNYYDWLISNTKDFLLQITQPTGTH